LLREIKSWLLLLEKDHAFLWKRSIARMSIGFLATKDTKEGIAFFTKKCKLGGLAHCA